MNEKNSSSPLDAALAQVDPERRRFLAMLLAGAAALPVLTSASLSAESETHFPKAEDKSSKTGQSIKDNGAGQTVEYKANTVKAGPAAGVKSSGSKSDIKYWRNEGTLDKNQTVKNSQTIKHSSVSPAIKGENSAIKGETRQIKGANPAIKGEIKSGTQ